MTINKKDKAKDLIKKAYELIDKEEDNSSLACLMEFKKGNKNRCMEYITDKKLSLEEITSLLNNRFKKYDSVLLYLNQKVYKPRDLHNIRKIKIVDSYEMHVFDDESVTVLELYRK